LRLAGASCSGTIIEKGSDMANSIVITGAGGGIGRRTALTFLEAGWNVALVGRRADALEDTASTAAEAGSVGEALALPGDVTDASAVEDIFAAAAVKFGRIDALFNNAGRGSPFATIDETPVEDFLGPSGRADHQQRIDLGPCSAAGHGALHHIEARDHRVDPLAFA
jgi:NAD(P)-dependent dehydrogenase (short-subunit alcohol dehydrogenase family)